MKTGKPLAQRSPEIKSVLERVRVERQLGKDRRQKGRSGTSSLSSYSTRLLNAAYVAPRASFPPSTAIVSSSSAVINMLARQIQLPPSLCPPLFSSLSQQHLILLFLPLSSALHGVDVN